LKPPKTKNQVCHREAAESVTAKPPRRRIEAAKNQKTKSVTAKPPSLSPRSRRHREAALNAL
jgi:hypothetical protein